MTQHTKDQLSYGEDNDGWYLQHGDEQLGYALSESNARRIVACVNACSGFSTEVLENMLMLGETIKSRTIEGIERREELFAKLKECEELLSMDSGYDGGLFLSEIRELIARHEG